MRSLVLANMLTFAPQNTIIILSPTYEGIKLEARLSRSQGWNTYSRDRTCRYI